MIIKNVSNRIIKTLKELIRFTKLLIALKKAETFYGERDVIERITKIANECCISSDLAIKVARCESGLRPLSMRMNVTGSIDRGLFQWNDYYHPEISNDCAFNIECSTRAFCKAVLNGNLYWWDSSKHCWG